MQIETRAFGPVVIDQSQMVSFTDPMPGFPEYTRFALLEPEPGSPFKWLQSLERVDLCFLISDPRAFFPEYTVEVRASDLSDLEIASEDQPAVAVVLTVPAETTQATANLLAPIIFNRRKKTARQVILEGSGYPVRAPLFGEERLACQNE